MIQKGPSTVAVVHYLITHQGGMRRRVSLYKKTADATAHGSSFSHIPLVS